MAKMNVLRPTFKERVEIEMQSRWVVEHRHVEFKLGHAMVDIIAQADDGRWHLEYVSDRSRFPRLTERKPYKTYRILGSAIKAAKEILAEAHSLNLAKIAQRKGLFGLISERLSE